MSLWTKLFPPPKTHPESLDEINEELHQAIYDYAPMNRAHLPLFVAVAQPGARVWATLKTALDAMRDDRAVLSRRGVTTIEVRETNGDFEERVRELKRAIRVAADEAERKPTSPGTTPSILDAARAYMDTHNPMQHWQAWAELRAILDGKPTPEGTTPDAPLTKGPSCFADDAEPELRPSIRLDPVALEAARNALNHVECGSWSSCRGGMGGLDDCVGEKDPRAWLDEAKAAISAYLGASKS